MFTINDIYQFLLNKCIYDLINLDVLRCDNKEFEYLLSTSFLLFEKQLMYFSKSKHNNN